LPKLGFPPVEKLADTLTQTFGVTGLGRPDPHAGNARVLGAEPQKQCHDLFNT
jgi:hypothetical protein